MEGKLEYTEAHMAFQKMYENKLQEIIEECGTTVEAFYTAIKTL